MKKVKNLLNRFLNKGREKTTEEIVIEVLKNFYFISYGMRKKIAKEGEDSGHIIQGIGMDVKIEREFNKCTEIMNSISIVLRECLQEEISREELEQAMKEYEEKLK